MSQERNIIPKENTQTGWPTMTGSYLDCGFSCRPDTYGIYSNPGNIRDISTTGYNYNSVCNCGSAVWMHEISIYSGGYYAKNKENKEAV